MSQIDDFLNGKTAQPQQKSEIDAFLDGAPEPGLAARLKQGASRAIDSARTALTDDPNQIAQIAAEQARTALPQTETQRKMAEEIAPYSEAASKAEGVVDNVKAWGALGFKRAGQLISNPAEAGKMIAEQLPNSLPGLAGGFAGAKAGAALGTAVAPGVGTVIGGIAGGLAGGFAGGYGLEKGASVQEQVQKQAQDRGIDVRNEAEVSKMLQQSYPEIEAAAQRKGVGTAGTDAVLNVATMGLAGLGGRMLAKEARTLAEGVKAGTISAADAATELARLEAVHAARNTLKAQAMRGTGVVGAEMAGEGVSEAVGQKLAYGEVNPGEVVDEALLGLGSGGAMALGSKAFNKAAGVVDQDATARDLTQVRDVLGEPGRSSDAPQDAAQQQPDMSPPLALPAPVIDVAQDGTARTAADRNARLSRIADGDVTDVTPIPSADSARDSGSGAEADIQAPAEVETPRSVAMGLDPAHGPLTAGAALAVDTGVTDQMQQTAALTQAADLAKKTGAAPQEQKQPAVKQALSPEEEAGLASTLAGSDLVNGSIESSAVSELQAKLEEVHRRAAENGSWNVPLMVQRKRLEDAIGAARQALQAELDAEQAGTVPGAEQADAAFASVTEDAGPLAMEVEQSQSQANPRANAQEKKTPVAIDGQAQEATKTIANIPTTSQGVTNGAQANEAQQGSAQPPQVGAAPAVASGATDAQGRAGTAGAQQPAVAGLNDGAPAANPGAQAAPAPGAQAAPTAEDRAQRLNRMGEAWARMPAAERQALAQRADLKPIAQKNVHRGAWDGLNRDVQRKLADAMEPPADMQAFAPETGTLGTPKGGEEAKKQSAKEYLAGGDLAPAGATHADPGEATSSAAVIPSLFSDPRTGAPIVVPNKATADAMARSKQLSGKVAVRKATPAEMADDRNAFTGYNAGEARRMGYVLEMLQPQVSQPNKPQTKAQQAQAATENVANNGADGDDKARWLKSVADMNRMSGQFGAQIDGVANGRLSVVGNPNATKQGRALMAAVDEARRAGATNEEIAAAATTAQPIAQPQAALATHADPGQAPEPATPAVVAQSVQKAARNEDVKPSAMRAWVLAEIDKAMLDAPEKDATEFVSFDVPGDGTFKVQKSRERLQAFRKQVQASPGFKDGGQKPNTQPPEQTDTVRNGSGSTVEAIRNFLSDGDVHGAVEFAKLKGVEFTPVEPRASMTANGKFKRVPASVKSSVPSVADGLTQVEAEQINQYLTAEQARAEPADAQDADVQPSPQDFIPAPDGGLDYGEITPEMGKAMRRQAGKIRLQHGVQNSNGTGWGLVHIEANHGKQISGLGFGSVQDFVAHVASSIQQVWQVPGNSQLLLTLKDGRKDVMYIQLEIVKEGDFYRVNSAFPVRQEDYESLKGMKKIWDGSEPTSAVTGQRPAFATAASASPESESSQGSSNARGQDASVPPTAPEAQPITRADVTAAQQQARDMIAQAIDAMSAGELNKIAKRFLPTMGLKPTISKERNKAAMLDQQVNLQAAADELGAILPADVKRALQADMEGRVADAATDNVAAGAAPASAAPVATELTPKQFHEAKLAFIAADTGTPLAEVRENYDTEAGRAEHNREWAAAVEEAAKGGQSLTRQTLDKLFELAPNARLPESAIPDGYQRPEARKAETEEKQARADNRKKANAGSAIEDAGEKIGGARKDRWKERGLNLDDLDAMTEAEGAELATKANVWKPDYDALAEASEPVTAAMVKTIYDQLAAKPKKNTPEGRRQYVQMMRIVRDVLTEAKGPDAVRNAYLEIRKRAGLNTMDPEAKEVARGLLFSVYKGRSDPFVLGGADLMKAKKMVEDGFPAKAAPWKSRLTVGRREGGNGVTERGIEMYMELSADVGTPLSREQIEAGFFRVVDKQNKTVAFAPTKEDAEAAAETVYERDLKGKKDSKPEPVRPNLDELKRENLPRRIDRDVTADDFVKDLGFRGIEFGNWSAQDERQRILNMAYDGLMDLAEIMGVPPKAMSLNGTLGMAFGARGGGRFAAHYEPGKLVINMTKIRGGGSMAHEWAHALDHYFGELDKADAYTTQARGASGWYAEDQYVGVPRKRMERVGNEWKSVEKMRLDNLRPEMAAAFDEVMRALFSKQITKAEMVRSHELDLERTEALARNETQADLKAMYQNMAQNKRQALNELRGDPEGTMYAGRGRTEYANQAQALSGKSVGGYWVRPTEMFARAFESWVFDRVTAMGARSDYLVHGVEEDRFAGGAYKGNPYPTGEERARINAAFDKLAQTIKTKKTGQGVAMFSRSSESVPQSAAEWLPDTVIADEVEKRIGGFAQQPPVRIRDTAFGQLPGVARNDNVAGAVHDGAIYLFRDQLGDRAAVQRTLFHELFHYGLRKFLTKEQFTGQMMNLYRRDKAIRDEADRWAATGDGLRAKELGGSEYALARGVDEALAILAEPNGGPHLNQTARAMFVRRVTSWLADVAQFLKMDKAAAYLRSLHNSEARAYIQSVFKRLETVEDADAADWAEADGPAFSREPVADKGREGAAPGFNVDGFLSTMARSAAVTRAGTHTDRAIMDMVREGRAATDILRLVAGASKSRFNRQVARLLLKTGIAPAVRLEQTDLGSDGGFKFLGKYSRKFDTVSLTPGAELQAEHIVMHELMHAATLRALDRKGQASLQMRRLYEHVKRQGGAAGQYGMKNVGEFVAEAFTNPEFQRALRGMSAPSGSTLKSAWDGFVRILRSILGLPQDAHNALSQALELGVAVMREDMALRQRGAQKRQAGDAFVQSQQTRATYEGRIDTLFNGGKAQVGTAVLDRSDVMGLLGHPDVPLMLNERHLLDGMTTHPEMTAAAWKKVPGWLENPAMVYSDPRDTGRLVVIAPDLIAGYPVMMVVEPKAGSPVRGKEGGSRAEQLLVTVYAKTGSKIPAPGFLATSGNLLYLDMKNAPDVLQRAGVQFPGQAALQRGRKKILTEKHLNGWRKANLDAEAKGADGDDAYFGATDLGKLKSSALDQLHRTLSHPGKVSLWDKTVGTMRHLAERSPAFKPVYQAAQRFIDDVSMLGNDAADRAPRLLPRVETLADLKKKPITPADNKAVGKPLFEGTLLWARDVDGRPMLVDEMATKYANLPADDKARLLLRSQRIDPGVLKMWQGLPVAQYESAINARFDSKLLRPGVVWSANELKSMFGLTDGQVSLYQEARMAIDRSIDMTARADMLRLLGDQYAPMRDAVLEAESMQDALTLLVDTLEQEAQADPEMRERLADLMHRLRQRHDDASELMKQGYTPLSRFGKYTVDVVDANGERQYFGMFESMREANQMAMRMRDVFKGAAVTQGTMSDEAYKLFQGITPESLEQFGNMLGLDSQGDSAQDKAFQAYLQLAKNNHSALKRLIHRKGIAGYSEDVGRVLASFVYSNARLAAGGLNAGTLEKAIEAIPKEQGELRDVAMGLRSYIQDPQEEGQAVRGMLFAQYLGGSVASAMVNMTQPFQITMPWLSQFGGMRKAATHLGAALRDMARGGRYEADLAHALHAAEVDGVVSPQEIHQLMAQARGTGSLRTGDGTRMGDARAAAANNWERVKVAWGQPFALAEQFNRRSTFIAAYRMAKEQGIASPAEFARRAVLETQFVYSKANKMRWGRGAIGGTLMTFKTYSVSYLELMHRMWTQGGPEGKRAVGWAVAMLLLMGGAGGLPFMEDAEDLIDGAGQLMGYNVSSKQWRKQALRDVLGKELADFVEQGVSGLPGAPVDVSGRLGMGNLIPGTGLLLSKQNRERDLLEIAGPAGDLVARGFTGARKALTGDVAGAALEVSPTAIRNLAKGADMASSGIYKDTKGYKVIDTTLDEAIAKAIGFQPRSVAEVQQSNAFMLRSKSFYTQTSSDIKAQWAQALFNKDDAALERVRERLADWNRDNPDQPIVVKMPDVWKRVREMGKDRTARIADTAPKALRQQMRDMARENG